MGSQMDPKWKLLYEGNATEYCVQNLVPQYVIDTEPGATASVQFCLRTVGADFPLESYSLMSDVSTLSTCWNNKDLSLQRRQHQLNRAKKEVIRTRLAAHPEGFITMERWNGNVYSEGLADAYV